MDKIIEKLKSESGVDSVFITGSNGVSSNKSYSDIDLVMVYENNDHNLYCLYTFADSVFTEVFFFDHKDLDRIFSQKEINTDDFDAIFVDWLKNSNILFDKSGKLTKLKDQVSNIKISEQSLKSKRGYWQRINHNYVTDKRYFDSGDSLYHEALEVKLLYSVEQVFCSYFAFRDIPWRGEKNAIKYLQNNDTDFYEWFKAYISATSVFERFKAYEQMFFAAHTTQWEVWDKNKILILDRDFQVVMEGGEAHTHINNLFGSK